MSRPVDPVERAHLRDREGFSPPVHRFAPAPELTDTHLDLTAVPGLDGGALAAGIDAVMRPEPGDPAAHQRAVDLLEEGLAAAPQVDDEGLLVNAVVEYVESDTDVHRVSQVVAKFGLTERTLQRLCARRIGLGPKWLIQRRRLHEAAERLTGSPGPGAPDLARVAVDLGYADQAHFTRDFRTVTGLTPGGFAAERR